MKYFWVVQRLKDGLLHDLGKESVLVWRLISADQRLEPFLFSEHPIKEAQGTFGDVDSTWFVDPTIQRKLNTLNKVKCDCVLKTAVNEISHRATCGEVTGISEHVSHQLEANICQVQCLGGIIKVKEGVHWLTTVPSEKEISPGTVSREIDRLKF